MVPPGAGFAVEELAFPEPPAEPASCDPDPDDPETEPPSEPIPDPLPNPLLLNPDVELDEQDGVEDTCETSDGTASEVAT